MPAHDVFLSYSRSDQAAADELHARLSDAGLSVFKDDAALRSGDRWLDKLQEAVAHCSTFVVLVGSQGIQRWVGAEVGVALVRHLGPHDDALRLPIHPILLGDATPDLLPPFLSLFQCERWARGDDLAPTLVEALRQRQQLMGTAARVEGCPFVGLASFQRDQAHLFFGRRAETLEALAGLGDQQQRGPDAARGGHGAGYHRWLQIEGHSGSGKSSLVHAGLLPLVERGALWPRTGLPNWQVLGPMMPGARPTERLAELLEHALQPDPTRRDLVGLHRRLVADDKALALHLRGAKRADTGFLLVIDQFEEQYTLADATERRHFDALLAHALQDADCPLFVVSTVRADFLDRIEQGLPRLAAVYNARCKRYLLPQVSTAGLREAIEMPARLAGLDVGEVSTAMLRDAEGEPGALPLVENALRLLWNEAGGQPKLSGAAYERHKGLAGMLSADADALLRRIGQQVPGGETAALEVLLRLTHISPDDRHARRRIARADAVQAAGNGNVALGERVLALLAGERDLDRPSDLPADTLRLVTTGVEGGAPYVDLIHETLLRRRPEVPGRDGVPAIPGEPYWPRLWGYVDVNRDRPLLHQQLDLQIKRYRNGGRATRWFRLAGWGQLLDYRRLRVRRDSTQGRFLALSRRVSVALWAATVTVSAVLAESAWWATVNNLPLPYMFVQPLWLLGWAPVPEMVPIPAGTFEMGCKVGRDDHVVDGEKLDCEDNDLPRAHPVVIAEDFEMGATEVTFLQYDYFVWRNGGWKAVPDRYPSDERWGRFFRPVIRVTWRMADDYTEWLTERRREGTGKVFRLPTEAEWEYAARLGDATRRGDENGAFPWGRATPKGRANCAGCGEGLSGTVPVRSYAGHSGLYDMAGNVWEWTNSRYDPNDGADNASRVLRGGSWVSPSVHLRAAHRFENAPDDRNYNFGFRVCRSSPIGPLPAGALDAGFPAR